MRQSTSWSWFASLQEHARCDEGPVRQPRQWRIPMKIALRSRPAKRVRGAAPLVVAAVLGSASAAVADGFKITEKLTATVAAPGARGRAVVVVRHSDRKVRGAVQGLQRSTTP